jgi:uncharacterized membrane protein
MVFNDALLGFYITLALYCLIKSRMPLLASLFFTLAISVKAGAVLLVPGFLGWI